MKKLFIIGLSGLTGYKLAKLSVHDYNVSGTYNDRPIEIEKCKIFQLDKTNEAKTHSLITKINPDVVIDCSALHNVNYCETHKDETWNVNVIATKNIAELCKQINARMIYISTDYVFDGKDKNYNENSTPNPLNYYGISKLKAEETIANSKISYAIARTSLVFGWNPGEIKGQTSSSGKSMNFVIWALNKLKNNENLKIVTDQYSTPTLADNLAENLLVLSDSDVNGIFHIVGKDCINRYKFTLKIAEIFNFSKDLVAPVTSEMFEQIAKRPMCCCLNSIKAQEILKIEALTIEDSLLKMKEQENEF